MELKFLILDDKEIDEIVNQQLVFKEWQFKDVTTWSPKSQISEGEKEQDEKYKDIVVKIKEKLKDEVKM